MIRNRVAVVLGTLVLGAGLAGCSGGGSSSSSGTAAAHGAAGSTAGSTAGGSEAQPTQGTAGSSGSSGSGGAGLTVEPAAVAQALDARSIIYTGTVDVRVDDVDAATNTAQGLATGAGGFVFGERSSGTSSRSADLTLKVPSGAFQDVFAGLKRLGTVVSADQEAQDVTQQVVDLQSRLATQKASVARVRALMGKATTIGQIVDIEGELTSREADLESLEAQVQALSNEVALATITVHLAPKGAPAPKPAHHNSFVSGVLAGWHAFAAMIVGVGTFVGAALPFLALFGALAALGWWIWRTTRRRPAADAADPARS